MKNIKTYIIVALFFGNFANLLAQPLREVPIWMTLEVAEERYDSNDLINALELYEQAYNELRELDLAYRIAEIHHRIRDYKRSERWYERVVEKDEMNQYPDAVLQYGRALKINGKYQEAIDAFNKFAGVTENDSLLALADNEVAGIQLAIKEEAPIELVIENLGSRINSSYTDFAPTMTSEGELYFASIDSKDLIYINGKEGDYWSKIYKSKLDDKGKWDKPKSISKRINLEGYHTGNPAFSESEDKIYFTRTLMELNDMVDSKIFVSEKNGENWGAPNEVTGINGDYLNKNPNMGVLYGKDVIFFSSNMSGGLGGFDLYYAETTADGFGLPTNLGPKINSAGDEITPFFQNNRLYFSTDGRPSLGGIDIYYADWDGKAFSESENMGAGYNSSFDDLNFSINKSGSRGFIVSNRPSKDTRSVISKTCCDEIFEFVLRDIVIDLLTQVTDGTDPLPGATVTVFEIDNNKPINPREKTSDDKTEYQFLLDFDKSYKVLVEKDGYKPTEFEFNTVGLVDDHTVGKRVSIAKIPSDEPEMDVITINEPIRLNKINFDLDDDKILRSAEPDLNAVLDLMNQYPDMVIELSAHTDAQGQDDYNQRLSQRRAQSTKNWLTNKGI